MLLAAISQIISTWFAFLLPSYSTFKALSHRPISEPELQRWSQYWVVFSLFVGAEYSLGWLINWFPFYYEMKTLFLLFLSLPQTQGSTYVYNSFVEPWFSRNETDIDAGIERAKTQSLAFAQGRLSAALDTIWGILSRVAGQKGQGQPTQGTPGQPVGQTPAGSAPANYMEMATGLWNSYGPAVMGALARGKQQAQAAAPAAAASRPPPSPAASTTSFMANPTGGPAPAFRPSASPAASFMGNPAGPATPRYTPMSSPAIHQATDENPPPFPVPQI